MAWRTCGGRERSQSWMESNRCIPGALYSSNCLRQMDNGSWRVQSRPCEHLVQGKMVSQKKVKNSFGQSKFSHKFVGMPRRPPSRPVRLASIITATILKMGTIRPRTHARTSFCFSVFTEQRGPPKFRSPTCSAIPADLEN